MEREREFSELTAEEKNERLYFRQKATLDAFLSRGAISRAQYEKSLSALKKAFGK